MKSIEGQAIDNTGMLEMLREKFPDMIFREEGNAIIRIPKRNRRQKCINHYADPLCEPMEFAQFDGWDLTEFGGDDIMPADIDGHCLTGGETWELRRSPEDLRVRVHIPIDSDPKMALALMQKLTDWVQRIADSGAKNFRRDSNRTPF